MSFIGGKMMMENGSGKKSSMLEMNRIQIGLSRSRGYVSNFDFDG
jgi:hypothetical protein